MPRLDLKLVSKLKTLCCYSCVPESELSLIEQSSSLGKQQSNRKKKIDGNRGMEKRDSIDLSAIDWWGSLHCALRVEMHAVCQLMGMILKRCQVVRGHWGGGWDLKRSNCGRGGRGHQRGRKGTEREDGGRERAWWGRHNIDNTATTTRGWLSIGLS